LAHKVNKEAARTIVEWIRPKEQYIVRVFFFFLEFSQGLALTLSEQDEWVPINFELPTGHGLPRNSILETFTYTDYEITALTPLSGPGFDFMFKYLRAPLMINETNAAEHIDEFREGMEFLVRRPKYSVVLQLILCF
jgi:hypothetical protein